MKKSYLIAILFSAFAYTGITNAVPRGTMIACTFHDVVYETIPYAQECSELPSVEYDLAGNSTHFDSPVHHRNEPHNPECFSSYLVYH